MNKYRIITMLAAATVAASGCYTNTDEVDYRTVNEVTVSDEMSAEEIVVDRFETLTLTPTITQTMASGEDNLEFEWKIRENTTPRDPYPYYELGDSRNLSVEVDAAVGIHRIVYSVTDRTTGVSTYLYYDLRVIGEYTEGWTILEETAEGGDISMILPTGRVARNIYSKENGEYLQTPCVSLAIPNYGEYLHKMLIFTASGGIETSLEEFTALSGLADWFVAGTEPAPENTKPQFYDAFIYDWRGLIIDGQYHVQIKGGFPGDPAFGGALPAPEDPDGMRRDYYLAPFIGHGAASYATASPVQFVYDNMNQRFMYGYLNGLTVAMQHYPADSENAWDPSDVGMTMKHMDESNTAYMHNAVMEDEAGEQWLLRCDGTAVVTTSNIPAASRHNRFAASATKMPGQLKGFTTAMSSKRLDHMYFAIGNKIYHYDTPANTCSEGYAFGANERPVVMRSKTTGGSETLYVATFDGTEGRVYYFDLEPTGKLPETYSERFEGFGKIVDMKYKN